MPQQTIKQYFTALTVLHVALTSGVIIFIVIAYFLHGSIANGNAETLGNIFQYMVPALAIIGIVAGNILYKKQVNEIKSKDGLAQKLNAYRATFILRDALLEGPALFAIITFLLCGEFIFLAVAILIVLIFVLIKPSKDKIIRDLELSTDEILIMEDDDAIIPG